VEEDPRPSPSRGALCFRMLGMLIRRSSSSSSSMRSGSVYMIHPWRPPPDLRGSSLSIVIFAGIAAHARAATRATPLAFVVTRQGIAPRKSAPALGADMWPLTGVEFGVSLQIVEPAEPGLARLTHIWLLLAVGQQVAI